MKEDIANLKELIQLQQKYKSCGSYMVELQHKEPLDATHTQKLLFHCSAYLAEQTIATYKQPAGTLPPPPPPP